MGHLNTNLAASLETPAIKTPNQARMERLKIEGAENDIQLDRQTIRANEDKLAANRTAEEERKRKQQGVAKLSELLAQHAKVDEATGKRQVDHNAIMTGLAASGFGDTALAYDTTRRADEAAEITNELNQLKNAKEKGQQFASIVNGAITKRTPEAADQAIGSLVAGGFIKGQEAAQMLAAPKDDAFWARAEQLRDEHVDYDKQIDAYAKKREQDHKDTLYPLEIEAKTAEAKLKTAEAAGKKPIQPAEQARLDQDKANATQRATEHRETLKETKRGHDLTAQAARDRLEHGLEGKPPTGAERRVYSFYERAKNAEDVLGTLGDQMADKGLLAQGIYKLAPNVAQSEENQVYRQAQRQFTEARLRKDSGAAINPSEYASDEKTYFPQPGDTKTTLERKTAARGAILTALHRESGKAAKEAGTEAPTAKSGPKVGDVVNVGGKRVKIKALHGDGTFDGDEVK